MSTLRIELDGGTSLAPGQTLSGRVEWRLDESRQWLELRLLWHTAGKGTRDGRIIETRRFDAPAMTGRETFSFTMPAGPYSFSGSLISLTWALELLGDDQKHAERVELTLSPDGREIQLSIVA